MGRYTASRGQWEWKSQENGRLGASCPCRILTLCGKHWKVFAPGELGICVIYISLGVVCLCVTISVNYANYILFTFSVDVFPLFISLSHDNTFIVTNYPKESHIHLHSHQTSMHYSTYLLHVLQHSVLPMFSLPICD